MPQPKLTPFTIITTSGRKATRKELRTVVLAADRKRAIAVASDEHRLVHKLASSDTVLGAVVQ